MRELATIPLDASPFPDARQLWWKAELLKRWDAQRQVVAPIERAEPVHISISMAGAVALLAWLWRSVSTPNTALLFATVLSLTLLIAVAALTLQAPVWKRLSQLRSWARSAGMIMSLVGLLAFCNVLGGHANRWLPVPPPPAIAFVDVV
jgi:hypothetical protein